MPNNGRIRYKPYDFKALDKHPGLFVSRFLVLEKIVTPADPF